MDRRRGRVLDRLQDPGQGRQLGEIALAEFTGHGLPGPEMMDPAGTGRIVDIAGKVGVVDVQEQRHDLEEEGGLGGAELHRVHLPGLVIGQEAVDFFFELRRRWGRHGQCSRSQDVATAWAMRAAWRLAATS